MNFNKAEFYRSYGEYKQLPPAERTEFAFSGRSNVGKSSLINKIFNRKSLARVSSVPGKTATINFYKVDNCYMVDLPGYGYAKIAKSDKIRWSNLIEGYLMSGRDIALIFQLIDMRHPPSEDDLHMINFMIDNEIPFVIIFTKADKLRKAERAERMEGFRREIEYFDEITSVEFSAVTGEGTDKIRSIIEEIGASDNEE
ncbi:MAG: ribosome biogenesis GTP-binding protein YihA/YsxC [Oscillospiraceae bacterium]|nr:ribosome biogenesis GTP-binding protein YihA/YsxC [Oscillospiraceae bacterium]